VITEISDEMIEDPLEKEPPQIRQIDGDIIGTKLKNRRNGFVKNIMDYRSSFFSPYPDRFELKPLFFQLIS
jgi:hypothetical protein